MLYCRLWLATQQGICSIVACGWLPKGVALESAALHVPAPHRWREGAQGICSIVACGWLPNREYTL
eukprot:1167735-Prorocentrum_minimum.AAC.2